MWSSGLCLYHGIDQRRTCPVREGGMAIVGGDTVSETCTLHQKQHGQTPQNIVWCRRSSRSVDPSMFVKVSMRLILAAIPFENVDSCCWMYSKNALLLGFQHPSFLIITTWYPANLRVHAPPDRNKCVSILNPVDEDALFCTAALLLQTSPQI